MCLLINPTSFPPRCFKVKLHHASISYSFEIPMIIGIKRIIENFKFNDCHHNTYYWKPMLLESFVITVCNYIETYNFFIFNKLHYTNYKLKIISLISRLIIVNEIVNFGILLSVKKIRFIIQILLLFWFVFSLVNEYIGSFHVLMGWYLNTAKYLKCMYIMTWKICPCCRTKDKFPLCSYIVV